MLVLADAEAVLIQYLSAKLGVVTGRSLAEVMGARLGRTGRLLYWVQAEVIAAATDVAEVVGGAVALRMLLGLPLPLGGVLVGAVSLLLLMLPVRGGARAFERVIIGLLLVLTAGALCALVVEPPSARGVMGGLAPRFRGPDTVVLAASMLGATVMPHAIYLHSALVRDRHDGAGSPQRVPDLLRATRADVVLSLVVAGTVNVALLLLAATALHGARGADTLDGAHRALAAASGPVVAGAFAVGLLASSLASTSVGATAGASIMTDLLHVTVPVTVPVAVRRAVTLVPALAVLVLGAEPTSALLISQAALSLGIPFALVPLAALTGRRDVMGAFASGRAMRAASWAVAGSIVALNLVLVVLTVRGDAS